jgi:hypothetical protein
MYILLFDHFSFHRNFSFLLSFMATSELVQNEAEIHFWFSLGYKAILYVLCKIQNFPFIYLIMRDSFNGQ